MVLSLVRSHKSLACGGLGFRLFKCDLLLLGDSLCCLNEYDQPKYPCYQEDINQLHWLYAYPTSELPALYTYRAYETIMGL